MTVVRGNYERRTILDFGKGKVSKNRIRQALRRTEAPKIIFNNNNYTCFDNCIQIGMYEICIVPNMKSSWDSLKDSKTKIKDYGGFTVEIFEKAGGQSRAIDCRFDKRFKEQSWVPLAYTDKVRVKHLLEMILYCSRLNNLRVFN